MGYVVEIDAQRHHFVWKSAVVASKVDSRVILDAMGAEARRRARFTKYRHIGKVVEADPGVKNADERPSGGAGRP